VPSERYEPVWLDSSTKLVAWIQRHTTVDWVRGTNFITQDHFYEHLRMTAERYDAIEAMPHWPAIPGIYYMHRPLPSPVDGLLDQLLDFFSPETPEDRELIKAMLFTWFWGGTPGQRPAWLITGPDKDTQRGRGLGKSTMPMMLASGLAGGYLGVLPKEDIADVKTRMLSVSALQIRVMLLDNVKAHRFSWADLEGLITSRDVSGRALYKGEGRRPNTLVWVITLNGASLSKDMA